MHLSYKNKIFCESFRYGKGGFSSYVVQIHNCYLFLYIEHPKQANAQ